VFIIRIFTGSVIGVISGIVLGLVGLFVLFLVVVGALAASGGPADCTPGDGPIAVDTAHSDSFRQKWNSFNAALGAGSPSAVVLTESEISSRADTYLKEKNTPFKDPRVCIHDGQGDAQAKIAFLGFTAKFKVTGTLDLTGQHPKAKIKSIDIGNVPGWMISPAETLVNRAIDSALNDVTLDHSYAPTLKPGEADVAGRP
jgi:hypothetical protein